MHSKIVGFVLGFGAGLLTLSVWLWSSGKLPAVRDVERVQIPEEAPKPPQVPMNASMFSSTDRPLSPPPSEAMRFLRPPGAIVSLPAPPKLQLQAPRVASADREVAGPTRIAAPIAGLDAAAIHDTYEETRGTDRMHEALDLMAPRGTPVLAAVEGNVVKIFESRQGGHTVYQFDNQGEYCYYYAHLDRYAPGLREGMLLRAGDVLGYVGSTGNAPPDAPHLHFAISRLGPDKKWSEGEPVNPYPLVLEAIR